MQDFSELYEDLNYNSSQLPTILQAQYLAPVFDDNTHNIWLLETGQGSKVLKKLNPKVNTNDFWIEVEKLFGINPSQILSQQQDLSKLLAKLSPLKIPTIDFAANSGRGVGFVLANKLDGEEKIQPDLNDLKKLSEHLIALEVYKLDKWGAWNNPEFSLDSWGEKLAESLLQKFGTQEFQDYWHLIDKAQSLQPKTASLTMLDLRWDQFLFEQDRLSALVDLDAFVSAPSELNWVILELIVSSTPLPAHSVENSFSSSKKPHKIRINSEVLNQVRDIYRLWLFSLNILGETDLAKWMARPTYF